jgi:hypothetical protein
MAGGTRIGELDNVALSLVRASSASRVYEKCSDFFRR